VKQVHDSGVEAVNFSLPLPWVTQGLMKCASNLKLPYVLLCIWYV